MRKKLGRCIHLVHAETPPQPKGRCVLEDCFPALAENKSHVLETLIEILKTENAIRTDSEESRARLCLDEALVNALMHGSHYDPNKNVTVYAYVDPTEWTLRIDDDGTGFRDEDLPDPDAPENLLEESGRGVHLMRSIMSDVSYWRGGRTLLMIQRRASGSSAALLANKEKEKAEKAKEEPEKPAKRTTASIPKKKNTKTIPKRAR